MLDVVDSRNFILLKYYRFAKDFHYANFEIIYQKVHFALLFPSRPLRYVSVPLHHWSEIVQYKDSNLLF